MAKEKEVLGADELVKLLKDLPDKTLQDKVLRDINRGGAKEYQDAMKAKSPVGSDQIFKNIKVKLDKNDKTGLLIGVTSKAFWAIFIEFGTAIRSTKGKGPVQFRSSNRGSISPRPFIQPAIEQATPIAIDKIFKGAGDRVSKFLRRETRKINKKFNLD